MDYKKKIKNTLTPISKKLKTYDFVGFDIETYNINNVQTFYFGSIYFYKEGKEIFETYFCRNTFISRLLSHEFKGYYIVATNLSFDYSSLFYGTKYWNDMQLVWRGSDLITISYKLPGKKGSIRFLDTFNYVGFSVAKLGSIIGVNKLIKPEYIGERKSNTIKELNEFIKYNKYDCKISCDFMYFLQKGINQSGGQLKLTIASSSLDTWRRSYMIGKLVKEQFTLQDDKIKEFIHKGYYGGRTEVFVRGTLYNMNYYDINSLYPSQMMKELPNPNSVFVPIIKSNENIIKYMGVTECLVEVPSNMKFPILPYRDKITKKLIFPTGTIKGVWNHNELNYAIVNGCKIIKIYKQLCYKHTFKPFNDYVTYLYNRRLEYKKQNNSMELVVKLLMNSLYGKWAQNKRINTTITDINLLSGQDKVNALLHKPGDIKDNYLIESYTEDFDGVFAFPILSSYISSYARVILHQYLTKYNGVYCDTDSIVTSEVIPTSNKLGEMKLESHLQKCIFVKPKMYYMQESSGKEIIKMKGVNKPNIQDFNSVMNGEKVQKIKFSKIKESVRRRIKPNTVLQIEKSINIQDDKRVWINDITSIPINITDK
jgi:hypothetical protein